MRKKILVPMVLAIGLSAESAKADFIFDEPTNLGPMLNSHRKDIPCSLSTDGLSLYFMNFTEYQPGGLYRPNGDEIWVTRRPTIDDEWGEPEHLGPKINTPDDLICDCMPHISADGLALYFMSNRPGGLGGFDIWLAARATTADDWEEPENLGPPVNSEYDEGFPRLSGDGLTFVFCDWAFRRPGGQGDCDLWISTRPTTDDPWGEPENLGETVNSPHFDSEPYLSHDGLAIVFSSLRPGGFGGPYDYNLWVTTRKTIDSPWGQPRNLGQPVNGSYKNGAPVMSADGSVLYFKSLHPGGYGLLDIWQAPVQPVVDLNGDGIIDADDMCIIVDNWGTDSQLCDIGPKPWGDGVVDVEDLIVVADHLFKGPGLVAHWALDETTGDVAYDSAGNIDATVYNGQWTEGRINGALDFNGLTTYMDCGDSLRLSTRKMTLAMWLEPRHMGGMRYILSRVKERSVDFDYVIMRHRYGEVEFAVAQEGSEPVSVLSNATTPLNEWTHVAVCMNGSEATIYINGQPDASTGYAQRSSYADCRLWISSLGRDTRFYNGKIDDIRVYNVALTAEEIAALAQQVASAEGVSP